jgi:chloramphenicol-sensitive protein RarD
VSDTPGASLRAGYLFGLIAYTWWGLVPLYFWQVKHVPAGEILAHRIVWSVVLMLGLTAVTNSWRDLGRVLGSRRLVLIMLASAVLLAANWLMYIYATVIGEVTEASLGYYMMPLVNAFLGAVFLGERLRPAHYPALGLVAVGVVVPFAAKGEFTWLAVALPITFGVYGLVRKKAPVDSLTGLTVESLLLLVPSVGFLSWQSANGAGHFGTGTDISLLLMFGGVVTVVPLLTYTLSIRRLPLIAVSFIQFLSPTVQLMLAVFVLGEVVHWSMWAAIGCVWAAVVIFIADAVVKLRADRNARGRPSPGLDRPTPLPKVPVTR